MGYSASDIERLRSECLRLPRPKGNYHQFDYVSNLLLTVLDYQLRNTTVDSAYQHYKEKHWNTIRTIQDLSSFLDNYPDTKEGNRAASIELWGYQYWNRIEQLRRLIDYFNSINVTTQSSLISWANSTDFKNDFEGKVKGLGYAIYKWLQIRVGIETIKPDTHIKRFVKQAIGYDLNDTDTVNMLEEIAQSIGWKINELDWAIWEHQRGAKGNI